MEIKILGSGCANCNKLEENTKKALMTLEIDAPVEKVKDFREIAKYGVMRTPALVLDGEVKVAGKVATVEELKTILNSAADRA